MQYCSIFVIKSLAVNFGDSRFIGFSVISCVFRRSGGFQAAFGLLSGCFQAAFRLLSGDFQASLQAWFLYIADNQRNTAMPRTDSPAAANEKLNQSPPEGTLRHVSFPGPNRVCNRRRAELSENELIDAESPYGLTWILGVLRVFCGRVCKPCFCISLKISEVPRRCEQTRQPPRKKN